MQVVVALSVGSGLSVAASQLTTDGMSALLGSRNSVVPVLRVLASMALLKVTATLAVRLTLVAPLAGVEAVTAGAVVSGGAVVLNTTSTQQIPPWKLLPGKA